MKRILLGITSAAILFIGNAAAQTPGSDFTGRMWNLEECMRYAVENSPAVIRQQLATANLKMDYAQAIMQHLPTLNGSVGANANYGRNIDPASNAYTSTSTFGNSYSASANLTLFSGLDLLSNTRITRVNKLRGVQEQQKTEDDIALQTMQSFFDLSYVMGTVTLAQEQLETSKKNRELTRRMLDLGMKSAADVAQIEADVAEQEYNLIKVENNLRTMELKLKEVMNFPLEETLWIDTLSRYGEPVPERTDIQELIEYATHSLPKAQMSVMDVRMQKLKYSNTKWKLSPTVSVWGSLGTSYFTKIDGGDGGHHFGSQFKDNYNKGFGGTFSVPVFNAWSRPLNMMRQRNNLRSMEQSRIQNIREIAAEVEQAVLDLNGALAEREQALKQVNAREVAYRVSLQKYNEGMLSVIDLQITSDQLLSARAQLLNADVTWQAKRKLVDYYKGIPLLLAY